MPALNDKTPVLAIVTAVEPLKLVPDSPVPIVKAFVVLAVTVAVPPRLIELPLIVIELLANCALVIVPLRLVVGIVDDVCRVGILLQRLYLCYGGLLRASIIIEIEGRLIIDLIFE